MTPTHSMNSARLEDEFRLAKTVFARNSQRASTLLCSQVAGPKLFSLQGRVESPDHELLTVNFKSAWPGVKSEEQGLAGGIDGPFRSCLIRRTSFCLIPESIGAR